MVFLLVLSNYVDVLVVNGLQVVVLLGGLVNFLLLVYKEDVVNYVCLGNDLVVEFKDG